MTKRTVVFTLFEGVQPLDLVGPHEVFAGANEALDHLGRNQPRYDLRIAAPTLDAVRGESGLTIVPTHTFDRLRSPVDTIVIPGGTGAREPQPELSDWLARRAPRARRTATVCTGTFLAAAAGLCDGHRVTTHWAHAGELARRHPELAVDPDPIYIRSGELWTSAGVTSGVDLSLALVEADLGAEIARLVARHLVVYLQRPGGQSQFASPVWASPTEHEPVRRACEIIHAELDGDLSVGVLAARVGLSERHFTRRFREEVGEPVGRHVERRRVEAASQILESESVGLADVARRCGFGTTETLRRAFNRRLQISPDAYRRQFATTRP